MDTVTFEIDGLYAARQSYGETPFTTTGSARDFGTTAESKSRSLSVAPRLIADVGTAWQITLQGLYAQNHVRYDSVYLLENDVFARFAGCVCNKLGSIEASAEGGLFALPAGTVRIAAGGGVRNATLHYSRLGSADIDRARTTSFAYGELSLPLISAANAMPGFRALSASVAGRYERYRGVRGVLSPKLGFFYTPVDGIDLKATWGRSFKAPTLNQQYSPSFFTLINADDLGFTTYPPGSTIGITSGGNPALKPERARTWSATLDLKPTALPGARLSITYFNVDFTGRVQVAVDSLFGSLGNPIYDPFIIASPSAAQAADAIAATSGGLQNQSGRPFDPAELVAIVDSAFRNVTRERAEGVDIAASYTRDDGDGRSIALSADASFLTSSRILIPGLSQVDLAGTVFYPPRFRARGGGSWTTQQLTLAAYLNHIGGVDDRRAAEIIKIHGQTTLDLAARLRLGASGWLRDTEVALSMRNAFNQLPAPIGTGFAYATPYDSTNYSAVGRVIGMQLSQRF